MDFATLIGIIFGLAALIGGFILEGGSPAALLQFAAALIVFGGTFGAVIASSTPSQLKSIIPLCRIAFTESKENPGQTIRLILQMATTSRREGLLALEQFNDQLKDNPFMQRGLQLVVDGNDPDLIRDILQLEINSLEDRHREGAKIFDTAGGFAPTMGIIGTVMGLVHVLSNLNEPESLGQSVALAFIATLYGVLSANAIYYPISNKLKKKSKDEILLKEMQTEGLLSIQSGENPTIVREKLLAFLSEQERRTLQLSENNEQGETNAKKAS